jgi:nucleotide-binding universal stress UspA family protein
MVNILAAMDPAETHFNAGVHAINLAKRIKAKVLFLLVYPPNSRRTARSAGHPAEAAVDKRLAPLIEEARADDITVEYYVAYGHFENELVSFVRKNKISLLVLESLPERDALHGGGKALLDKIRHRIDCLIEVVNEKSETSERKE